MNTKRNVKSKKVKEVVPEKERLRKVTTFKLNCIDGDRHKTIFTRYIIAETKEDAIEMLKNKEKFEDNAEGLLRNSPEIVPEIVGEESVELKITNNEFEYLHGGTRLWDGRPFDRDWIKLSIPNMKKFYFHFTKTQTITYDNEHTDIVAETEEDAIEQLKSKYPTCDLTDIRLQKGKFKYTDKI